MSYTYLQEQGEESSAASFSDIPAFVLSRLNLTAEKSCSNGNETASCPSSRYGMMCEPSTESRGEERSTLSAGDSPAKTLARPAMEPDSMEIEAGFGARCFEWFAKWNPPSFSWKTRQCSLFGDWDECSVTWPRWGTMQGGECSEPVMLPPLTKENACGFTLPTPTASDHKRTPMKAQYANRPETEGCPDDLAKWAVRQCGLVHARLVPDLWEWAMGWPLMWTELKPLETDKFQQWLNSHGKR